MTSARGHLFCLLLVLAAPAAVAQSGEGPAAAPALTFGTQGASDRTILFSAFLGVQTNPAYFGSDEMVFGPSFRAGVGHISVLEFSYGTTDLSSDPLRKATGFAYGLSFRYIGKRDSSEHDEIRGLDDIDPTLEVGIATGYVWPSFEVGAEARYGLGGSDAWVGELRANYVMRPTPELTLRVGPRLLFGSDHYVDTYFGIGDAESDRSGLDAFDPDPGLTSVGLEFVGTYQLGDSWWLEAGAKWQKFQGDAADSPIVREGTSDYTEFRIGLRRSFVLRF